MMRAGEPVRAMWRRRRDPRALARRLALSAASLVASVFVTLAPAALADGPARRIAVGRLEVDRPLAALRDRARATFEPMIEQRLRDAGYRVVSIEETDAIWTALRDSLGGFYDTYTGRVVPERYRAIHEGTRRALSERYQADAWLQPSLELFRLPFGGGTAEWHGTRQESGGRGGLAGFLIGRSSGTLNAMSLVAGLEDTRDGSVLYRWAGGVELATKAGGGGLISVAPDSLLRDDVRNTAAVGLALDSLATRWPVRSPAP